MHAHLGKLALATIILCLCGLALGVFVDTDPFQSAGLQNIAPVFLVVVFIILVLFYLGLLVLSEPGAGPALGVALFGLAVTAVEIYGGWLSGVAGATPVFLLLTITGCASGVVYQARQGL